MKDVVLTVGLGVLLYTFFCLIVALMRMLFSDSSKRKQDFKRTFWSFFLEIFDPFNWLV